MVACFAFREARQTFLALQSLAPGRNSGVSAYMLTCIWAARAPGKVEWERTNRLLFLA